MAVVVGARDLAAQRWFGYGRWSAPYWFVGMEPGGTDRMDSYESWRGSARANSSTARPHHVDCDFHRWHRALPATQPTWRRLIQLLLAYEGKPNDLAAAARYQRDSFGACEGDAAVLDLSALHPTSLDVAVEREAYREQRIEKIAARLDEHEPTFAMFYRLGYRADYERVAGGAFGDDGSLWRGRTLCVLAPHPAAKSGPRTEYWTALGEAMRARIRAGSGESEPQLPSRAEFARKRTATPFAPCAPWRT